MLLMCGAVFEQAAAASGVSAGLDPAQQLQQAQRESAQQQQVRTNTAGLAATGTTSPTLSLSSYPCFTVYLCWVENVFWLGHVAFMAAETQALLCQLNVCRQGLLTQTATL